MTKKRLGTNLNALLGNANLNTSSPNLTSDSFSENNIEIKKLPIEYINRGKYQPRQDMHPEALEELAESIKIQGIIQPIIVRHISSNKYEIIAGERRWRAAQLTGMSTIPAVIRDIPDDAAIAIALIENIQRENLNPMEEAIAFSRLQKEFNLTQQEVAQAVGKSRTAVANLLRLMMLNTEVKRMLEYGDLEMGHARALLALPEPEQIKVAQLIVSKGLSVRQTEEMVRQLQSNSKKSKKNTSKVDPNIFKLEEGLSEKIGAAVSIKSNARGKGKLIISYNSHDELDGILLHIK